MFNIKQIASLDFCNMSVEDLSFTLASMKATMSQYGHEQLAGIEAPNWLIEGVRSAARELNEKIRDQRAATLKKMKMQRENLRTAEEKRSDLDRQIAELEKQID